jgi:hypothetical protein
MLRRQFVTLYNEINRLTCKSRASKRTVPQKWREENKDKIIERKVMIWLVIPNIKKIIKDING